MRSVCSAGNRSDDAERCNAILAHQQTQYIYDISIYIHICTMYQQSDCNLKVLLVFKDNYMLYLALDRKRTTIMLFVPHE